MLHAHTNTLPLPHLDTHLGNAANKRQERKTTWVQNRNDRPLEGRVESCLSAREGAPTRFHFCFSSLHLVLLFTLVNIIVLCYFGEMMWHWNSRMSYWTQTQLCKKSCNVIIFQLPFTCTVESHVQGSNTKNASWDVLSLLKWAVLFIFFYTHIIFSFLSSFFFFLIKLSKIPFVVYVV